MGVTEANKVFQRKEQYINSKLDRLDKGVAAMEKDLLNLIFSKYTGQFDRDASGKLKPTAKNLRLAKQLDKVIDEFDEKIVRKFNTKFGQDLLGLTKYAKEYYSDLDVNEKTVQSLSKSLTGIEEAIGIRDGEIIKGGYLDDLTKMSAMRMELKNYVLNSVASSKGYSDYLKGWTELIKSAPGLDGRLKSYYRQYAFDTFNQVDAAVNMHYAENLGLKYFIYAGSIISNSRDFCIKRAGKTFSVEETKTWKNDPSLPGKSTAGYNPLIDRGRWNCRHSIKYVTDETACQTGKTEACEGVQEETAEGFVDAKSIKGAEEFARTNLAKKVDYSNLTVAEANNINKTLAGYKNKYGIQLEAINVTNKGGLSAVADAQMIRGEGTLTYDIKAMRNDFKLRQSNTTRINKRIADTKKELEFSKSMGWDDDIPKLQSKIKTLEKELTTTPDFYSFSQSSKNYDQYMKYVTDHEYAHIIQGYKPVLNGKTRLEIASHYSDVMANPKLYKTYTDYSRANWDEFWAEGHAMKVNGKLKDSKMSKLLDKIDEDAKSIVP